MSKKKITRRRFLDKTATGLLGSALASGVSAGTASLGGFSCTRVEASGRFTTEAFAREVERLLPMEKSFDYHKRLVQTPVHIPRRDRNLQNHEGEIVIPEKGWSFVWNQKSATVLQNAVQDFQDYLDKSMGVRVEVDGRDSLEGWQNLNNSIVVGTRDQMPGCGMTLKGPKDYEIKVSPGQIVVCGFDERGAMFGLYNLEARMNLREAPFLPGNLRSVRHSLYDVRLVMSWMGWMEWPDILLSHLAHAGFDGIYASPMANPNGDRTTAESSTEFYSRILYTIRNQDPARVRDLINRAARYGIKVYAPIIYQFMGTPESEAGLRKLVRDNLKEFPDIKGYILLTEGFWYKEWHGTRDNEEAEREWIRNWAGAVGIVTCECHKVNPSVEILPWDYNIANRREKAEMKRYLVRQLPGDTIPLLTWENGKSFKIDEYEGKLNDYSISQIGPSEVAHAQIEEARIRKMKVYCNADTFVCGGQFQTVPYQPFPYQWYERYKALEKYGVNGTLESWTSGFTPNFMSELRAWYCWSDTPPLEELLGAIAARNFGNNGKDLVTRAWDHFSQAIRMVPDTGPTMGTSNAIGNPLFFEEPHARTATFRYSWMDQSRWMSYLGGVINPYWPYAVFWLTFVPDFTNKTNKAESYARGVAGIQAPGSEQILPVFLKYLRNAANQMEEGLKLYREAALISPGSKRQTAVREVIIAEQIQRMMQSECAILEFEDLRFQFFSEKDDQKKKTTLDRMESIVREEIKRTEFSLVASSHDSRLGFQQECDYVYNPYTLKEKLGVLHEILETQLPAARQKVKV